VSRALVMLAALALRVASLMIIIDSSTQKKPEKKTAKFAKKPFFSWPFEY